MDAGRADGCQDGWMIDCCMHGMNDYYMDGCMFGWMSV